MRALPMRIEELSESERHDFEERAGMYQFDANLPKDEAERLALLDIEARRNRKQGAK
jgi:hypothetical protein